MTLKYHGHKHYILHLTHLQSHGGVQPLPRAPAHKTLLFAPLELPEVVLYQEGGIELPHCYLVI